MKFFKLNKTVAIVFSNTNEARVTAMRILELPEGYRVLFFQDDITDEEGERDATELLEKINAAGIETQPLMRYDDGKWKTAGPIV